MSAQQTKFNFYELPNETTVETSSNQPGNPEVVHPGLPEFPPSPLWLFALKTTLCLAVLLVTITGNSLVVISFIKFRKLQTYSNYYIVTLALADLASGITPIILNVAWLIGYWPFGNAVCIVSVFLNTVFVHTTFLLTFIICVDRYRALCMPLKHLREKNRRHAAKMLLPGILFPFLLWSVVILILPQMGVFRPIQPFMCYIPYASNKAVLLGASIVVSWIPIVGTSCLYSLIFFKVIRRRRQNGCSKPKVKANSAAKYGTEAVPENASVQQPNGPVQRSNGPVQQPNGPVQNASVQQPNGQIQLPNGPVQQPNGPVHLPNGPVQQPNGPVQQPNHTDEPVTGKEQNENPNNIEIVMRSIGVSQQTQVPSLQSTYRLRSVSSRRATRTLSYIIVVMVISGTPYSIYSLLSSIWPDLPKTHTISWVRFVIMLEESRSGIVE